MKGRKSKNYTAAEKHFLGKEQVYRKKIKRLEDSLEASESARLDLSVELYNLKNAYSKLESKLEDAEARAEGRNPELEALVKNISPMLKSLGKVVHSR